MMTGHTPPLLRALPITWRAYARQIIHGSTVPDSLPLAGWILTGWNGQYNKKLVDRNADRRLAIISLLTRLET